MVVSVKIKLDFGTFRMSTFMIVLFIRMSTERVRGSPRDQPAPFNKSFETIIDAFESNTNDWELFNSISGLIVGHIVWWLTDNLSDFRLFLTRSMFTVCYCITEIKKDFKNGP